MESHFCSVRSLSLLTFYFFNCLIYYHFLLIFFNPLGWVLGDWVLGIWVSADLSPETDACHCAFLPPFCYSHIQCSASWAQLESNAPTVKTSPSHRGVGFCVGFCLCFVDLSARSPCSYLVLSSLWSWSLLCWKSVLLQTCWIWTGPLEYARLQMAFQFQPL